VAHIVGATMVMWVAKFLRKRTPPQPSEV